MAFYNYNPFKTDISDLEGKHLEVLRDVTEGWYVDYKEDILPIKKIAKHLSSFSNQYGGWLFFGIKESEERKAGIFKGLDRECIESCLLRIREASNAHVNPSVYYEEKVIYGPVGEIGLENDMAIIVLYIPEGAIPPYIESSGRIYRRLADQSYPVAETDRNVLDHLWNKGNDKWEKTKKFLSKRRAVNNSDIPVVYIHVLTNPYFNKYFKPISYDDFREIFLGKETELGMSMPMNSVHSVHGGFIAKQTKGNDPLSHVTTVRWWNNGNAMIVIPLNTINYGNLENTNFDYNYASLFLQKLHAQGLSQASVVDFNYFLIALAALYNQLTEIYKLTENSERVFAAFSLENAAKMVPFIDDHEYLSEIENNGAPIIEDSSVRIPESPEDRDLIEIVSREEEKKDLDLRNVHTIVEVMPIFASLFFSIGLINRTDDIVKYSKLFDLNRFVKP